MGLPLRRIYRVARPHARITMQHGPVKRHGSSLTEYPSGSITTGDGTSRLVMLPRTVPGGGKGVRSTDTLSRWSPEKGWSSWPWSLLTIMLLVSARWF